MNVRHLCAAIALLLLSGAAAQTAPDTGAVPAAWPKAFDAAVIEPGDHGGGMKMMMQLSDLPGGKFNATNIPLKRLIAFAFNVRDTQLEGIPAKLGDEMFSIQAVPPAGTPQLPNSQNAELVRHLVQALLVSRFGLQYTVATKQLDVYDLVVAKGGSKLKPTAVTAAAGAGDAPPPPPPLPPGANVTVPMQGGGASAAAGQATGRMTLGPAPGGNHVVMAFPKGGQGEMMAPGHVHAMAATPDTIADLLSNDLGRMVIDKTGLSGAYDFDLSWTPGQGEQMGGGGRMMMNGQPMTFDGPSLFTALQEQLGLKLQSAKGPVPVIQVTRLTAPTAN